MLCGALQAQNYIIYDVKPNDTPQSIAQENALSVDELYRFNPDLKKTKALDAQKIVIPKANIENFAIISYLVKPKQTLYSISKNFNVSIEELKAFNPQLYENELRAGETIKIPAYKLPKAYQDVDFNESIKNSNFSTFKHIVLPNERKADIVDKYGISYQTFDSLNAGITEVQSGQLVKIVKPTSNEEDQNTLDLDLSLQFYKVPRQQTMYSLTREFDISEDVVYKLNPIVRREGLKAGTIIKLPEKMSVASEVKKIVDLESKIQNLNDKKLALFLPFSLNQFKKDSADYKRVLLRDNLLNISLDFYEGVQLAIREAKSKGIYTEIDIFDTQKNPKVMDSLLMNNSLSRYDAIIGPILNKNIKLLSEELKNSKVPVFLPITNLEDSPSYVFNTLPRNDLKTELLITHLDSTLTEKHNLVFITDNTSTDKFEMYKYSFPDAKFHQIRKSYVETSEIKGLLDAEKENWIVLETNQIGVSESVVGNLYNFNKAFFKEELDDNINLNRKKLRSNPKNQYDIRLWTSDRNKEAYGNIVENSALSKLQFTYVSTSLYDILETSPLIEEYVNDNGHAPNRYVLRAYDLTYDIILRLAYEDQLNNDEALNPFTEYNENRFGYEKQFMSDAYENRGLYIIEFKPDFEVGIINSDRN